MIGIYGGTFNPVHYGHLRTALEVKEIFECEQLRLLPCAQPAHRQQPQVSAKMRLQMLELAVVNTELIVDNRELQRQGYSYMVDTLANIRSESPKQALILFIGEDAFQGLSQWHQWQGLFDYAHIVVMTRPDVKTSSNLSHFLSQRLVSDKKLLHKQLAGLLLFQNVTQLAISATQIRKIISAQQNPQFLLPDSVITTITEQKLYKK